MLFWKEIIKHQKTNRLHFKKESLNVFKIILGEDLVGVAFMLRIM